MAYWRVKEIKGKSYVYVYTYQDGKVQQVKPRQLYKHLDAFITLPDQHHNITTWVKEWGLQHEKVKSSPLNILFSDDRLNKLILDFGQHLTGRKKRDQSTVRQHLSNLRRFVVPYFLHLENPLKDPQAWPGASIGLLDFLEALPVNPPTVHSVNKSLRLFWRWMVEERIVTGTQELYLRNAVSSVTETPLENLLNPAEVLGAVDQIAKKDLPPGVVQHAQLLALIGYFFSLRPQETFALTPNHFVGGDTAQELACNQTLKQLQLFSRLAVNVIGQWSPEGKEKIPKMNSKGWVGCFDGEAAKRLVGILNSQENPDDRLFRVNNRELYRHWAKAVKGTALEKTSLKDLRRASLYYLGHHTLFQNSAILLMKHARHKEMETTVLYLRRPEEKVERPKGKIAL
jgi:hypothetical protein